MDYFKKTVQKDKMTREDLQFFQERIASANSSLMLVARNYNDMRLRLSVNTDKALRDELFRVSLIVNDLMRKNNWIEGDVLKKYMDGLIAEIADEEK